MKLTNYCHFISIIWDLNKGTKDIEFFGHAGDVMSMSLHPDKGSFVTGSVDRSIKVRLTLNYLEYESS